MSGPPPRRRAPLALPSILGLCLASAAPAGAQVVISSQGRDNVVVNSDVLDALGPPPGLPRLQLPNPAAGLAPSPSPTGERATSPESVPRSRVYALPPARTAAPSAPAPAPTANLAPPPAAPRVSQAVPPPALAEPPPPAIPRPAAAAPPLPATPTSSAASAAPPPIPPERPAPRVAVAPSAPPPPPALDTPAPPRPPARPVASAPAPTAPAAAAAPAPGAAPPQVAAAAGVLSRVLFSGGSADINEAGRRELSQLADRLGRDSESRIQLLAYADGTPESESQARRLSLSRALAVRSFLIDQGIRSTRVNVQALGIKATGGPADRVDALAVGP